jgi:hypothetical protein
MTLQNGTEIYLKENNEVRSLNKIYFSPVGETNIRRNQPYSISKLIWKRIKALRGIKSFLLEVLLGGQWLKPTFKLKNSFSNRCAIVCGNGPSQGFLDSETLKYAKFKGIHLITINFFLENKIFYEIEPDFVVISDWATWREDIVVGDSEITKKRRELKLFLNKRQNIKVFCPARLANEIAISIGDKRVFGFSDSELHGWSKNISPMFPRGYHSMTAYKALALAIWLGYKTKYIIGFDNTYPREVFCDFENRIMERSTHAYTLPYVRVLENCYENIGEYLSSIAEHFHDLCIFPKDSIINLDEYSLTDRFRKNKIIDFRKTLDSILH